jgi:FK506-binding protein 8
MNKGETSTITVAPRFGYGAKGLSPLVPPNAHLIYTIEVIDFDQEKDLDQLPLSKRRDIGNRKRERGNWWYGREEVTLAVQCYRRALEFLDEDQGGISYPKTDDPDEKVLAFLAQYKNK